MAGRGMGAATKGGGAVGSGPRNKMMDAKSKTTGPVMMKTGGAVNQHKKMAMGEKITTPGQAADAIRITLSFLKRANDLVGNFSIIDVATGVQAAYLSRIEQQTDRLQTLGRDLDKGFDRRQADRVALAIVQSVHLLADLRRDVAESAYAASIDGLAEQFAAALKRVLERAAELAIGAVPWFVWVGLAWLLLDQNQRD